MLSHIPFGVHMSQSNKPSLTQEQIEKLETIYPKLCSLFSTLEHFVSQSILDELGDIKNIVNDVFNERWTHEEDEFEDNYKKLNEIADQNNFMSIWSVDEVLPEDMDTPFSKDLVKSIRYEYGEGQEVMIFDGDGENFTWLQAWKYADQLIRQSGDTHHMFIEDFKEEYMGQYKLITGS